MDRIERERGRKSVRNKFLCVLGSERPYNRVRLVRLVRSVRSISSSGIGFTAFVSHYDILSLSLSLCLCVCMRNKLMYLEENKLM